LLKPQKIGVTEKIDFKLVGPIQTGFLMTFQKSYGGTGIMIPVKKVPQEGKKQESEGFLQELPV
jgi:hypothetical protein